MFCGINNVMVRRQIIDTYGIWMLRRYLDMNRSFQIIPKVGLYIQRVCSMIALEQMHSNIMLVVKSILKAETCRP